MGLAEGGLVTKFQFLMVRLKGFPKFSAIKSKIISIPYGAIKRIFVFLIVRHIIHFNSLWCD